MSSGFDNAYDDERRAEAYAKLTFPGTYYLAYRDLPAILDEHVEGRAALDFVCGVGRSTRFLRDLGFTVIGVDISAQMLVQARATDPEGDYRQAAPEGVVVAPGPTLDLILSAFTFDNIPTAQQKVATLGRLAALLRPGGRLVNLVSTPEIYVNEWASFSTRDFPGNREARSGDKVHIVMLDVKDRRPIEDVLWTDRDYRELYGQAGLAPVAVYRPLGMPGSRSPG